MCLLRTDLEVNLLSRLIPESPSWLLVKGRTKEALEQLERVAQCNKADLQVCPPCPILKENRPTEPIFLFGSENREGWLNKPSRRYNFRQANKDEDVMDISVLQLNCELTR